MLLRPPAVEEPEGAGLLGLVMQPDVPHLAVQVVPEPVILCSGCEVKQDLP